MNNKPYKLIDEGIRSRLLQAIRLGSYIEHACFYAGIDSSTFRKWRQKAENDIEPYKSFWKEVQLAESEAIMRRLARIEKVAEEGNWQADAWVLERKYPDKFGRRDRINVNLDPNKPVEVNLEWSDGKALDRDKEIVIEQEEE
tara:strand:+ start:114 stop:542 length:429 start_codon:yes stop_codon:yes gene_type:complete